MHTYTLDSGRIIHTDTHFMDTALIQVQSGELTEEGGRYTVRLSWSDLVEIVALKVADARTEEIECMTPAQLLGIPVPPK